MYWPQLLQFALDSLSINVFIVVSKTLQDLFCQPYRNWNRAVVNTSLGVAYFCSLQNEAIPTFFPGQLALVMKREFNLQIKNCSLRLAGPFKSSGAQNKCDTERSLQFFVSKLLFFSFIETSKVMQPVMRDYSARICKFALRSARCAMGLPKNVRLCF